MMASCQAMNCVRRARMITEEDPAITEAPMVAAAVDGAALVVVREEEAGVVDNRRADRKRVVPRGMAATRLEMDNAKAGVITALRLRRSCRLWI